MRSASSLVRGKGERHADAHTATDRQEWLMKPCAYLGFRLPLLIRAHLDHFPHPSRTRYTPAPIPHPLHTCAARAARCSADRAFSFSKFTWPLSRSAPFSCTKTSEHTNTREGVERKQFQGLGQTWVIFAVPDTRMRVHVTLMCRLVCATLTVSTSTPVRALYRSLHTVLKLDLHGKMALALSQSRRSRANLIDVLHAQEVLAL
jgi:hypothetical protein